jgi:hypothetical protein
MSLDSFMTLLREHLSENDLARMTAFMAAMPSERRGAMMQFLAERETLAPPIGAMRGRRRGGDSSSRFDKYDHEKRKLARTLVAPLLPSTDSVSSSTSELGSPWSEMRLK